MQQIEIQSSDGTKKFSGKLDTSYGGGGGDIEQRAWDKMQKAITIEETYDHGEPKLEQANLYLSRYQWLSDAHMNGLLFKREAGIPIKTHKFILNLTKESQKNLTVALSLNIPNIPNIPILGKLKATLQTTQQEMFDFSLTINVEFW